MAGYLAEARRHVNKIEYYHRESGMPEYAQATYHWNKLRGLMGKAAHSKAYKHEASLIDDIIQSLQKRLAEMESEDKGPGTE
jgi:hypothetical protein